MMRMMCKSKIHGATVTEANLHYFGSLTIDQILRSVDLFAREVMPALSQVGAASVAGA